MENTREKLRRKKPREKIIKRNENKTLKQGRELTTGEDWAKGKREVREERRAPPSPTPPQPRPIQHFPVPSRPFQLRSVHRLPT